jgi:hypothetical protein
MASGGRKEEGSLTRKFFYGNDDLDIKTSELKNGPLKNKL